MMRTLTGVFEKIETPVTGSRGRPSAHCTSSGSSSPSRWRMATICCGVA
jgi:hypothetical protein